MHVGFRFLAVADVGHRDAHHRGGVFAGHAHAVQVRIEVRPAGPVQRQLQPLLLAVQHAQEVHVPAFGILGRHEAREAGVQQPFALVAEHVGAGQVELCDSAFGRHGQVAHRREVVEVHVAVARDLQVDLRLAVLRAYRGLLELALERRDQAREVLLHHVVAGAGLHRLDGDLFAYRAGDEDERDVQPEGAKHLQRVHAAEVRQAEVRDHGVPAFLGDRLGQVRGVLHAAVDRLEAAAAQHPHGQLRVVLRILDDEDSDGLAHWSVPRGGISLSISQ